MVCRGVSAKGRLPQRWLVPLKIPQCGLVKYYGSDMLNVSEVTNDVVLLLYSTVYILFEVTSEWIVFNLNSQIGY